MKEQGFGFVWIAILLLVLGGVASTMIMRQENNAVWEPKKAAKGNLADVAEALVAYQRANHKLPCAAPLGAKPGDASYAVSVADCTVAGSGNTVAGGYHIGALPARTLGLSDKAAEDKWGNKLTYAVTIALTNPFSFTTGSGNMVVLGKTPLTDAAYVVVAHGPDAKGAFTSKAAVQAKACASVVGADQENCDNDATFLDADLENAAGAGFYDDQILAAAVDAVAQQQNKPCTIVTSGNAVWDGGQCTNTSWDTAPTGLLHGESRSIGETNSADADGTVTITCTNAVLQYSSALCVAHCNANPVQSWGTPANCQGAPPNTNHGAVSASVANIAPGFTGNATFSCNDGALTVNTQSCAPAVAPSCPTQTLSWGAGCSASFASITDGATSPSTPNTAAGFTGDATANCTGTTWGTPTGTCNVSCPSGGTVSESWWGAGSSFNGFSGTPPDCGSCKRVETARVFAGCSSTGGGYCNEYDLDVTFNCQSSCPAGTTWVAGMHNSCRPNSCINGANNPYGCTQCADGEHLYRERTGVACPAGYTGTYNVAEHRNSCSGGWIEDSSTQSTDCTASASDPCLDNGYGSGCLISGSDYGTGCIGTDIFGNGSVCCAGCSPPSGDCAASSLNGVEPCDTTSNGQMRSSGFGGPNGCGTYRCNNGGWDFVTGSLCTGMPICE